MFDNFSKAYESTFRIIFICWFSLWLTVDLINLVWSYAGFETFSDTELVTWLVKLIGQLGTIAFGVILVAMMANIPGKISKLQKIKNVSIITIVAIAYYLFGNILSAGSQIVLQDPNESVRTLVFQIGWLLPSLLFLAAHIGYTANLGVYNRELEEAKASTANSQNTK